MSSPIVERRPFSSPVAQPVFIIATRSNTTGAALVLLDVQYRSITGQQFSNAELQEDWGTTLLSLNNMGAFTNFIFLDNGQSQGAIPLYPTRVNFQRNPDRILSVRLLPPRPFTGQAYVINPNTTLNTVTITLRDNWTAPTQPYILNAIQNTVMTNGTASLIEIETPTLRADGLPSRVFVNERGSPLFYSTSSFHPHIVRAEIMPGASRPNGLAALRLTAILPGRANVILVAVDSANKAATCAFDVIVHQPTVATSAWGEAMQESVCYPNPASHALWVTGEVSGGVLCTLYSTQGQQLRQQVIVSNTEPLLLEGLPSGMYVLVIERRGKRIARAVWKQ
ncbi:MAG: T9SS type A sorting domain-containing protein [Bacteroidota bacterium]|nr:T9SS type A sorting domain-containing protein [Candidatus Kapabacteria bacterium]MDW8220622.1 T9SS type A sorting domain-containing protein [Bacteroidota bacterium]